MSTPREYVEAPAVTPLPFGLMSVATVLDETGDARWLLGGVQYQPTYSGEGYDSVGACDAEVIGTLTVSVDNAGEATITVTDADVHDDTFTITWGDDSDPETVTDPDGATHTYADPGDYTATVDGDRGYLATVVITVEDSTASGPFDGEVSWSKEVTSGIDLTTGDPFIALHMFSCAPLGGVYAQAAERARAALRLSEQRTVERVVARRLAGDPDAVDLTPTPGTAVGLVDAVALLEDWSAARYGGVPTIHMPRGVASVAATANAITRQGTSMQTHLGSLVAAGAGYGRLQGPGGDPAGDGEAWMYVTGQVVIRRGSDITAEAIDSAPATNTAYALAERPYVVTLETIVGAVLTQTPYGVPQ